MRQLWDEWNAKPKGKGHRWHYGFTAQEVKAVTEDRGVPFAGVADPKVADPDSDAPMTLRYNQFLAPLVKAVQELADRLDAIEAAAKPKGR
jgi:hypothetical protein